MNILSLTLSNINSITDRGIYSDLLRHFAFRGHSVTIVTPKERRYKTVTNIRVDKGVRILQVKTFNIQKTSFVEKGLGTLAIEYQYMAAIRKYLQDTKFDLVIYSTPPITFGKVIKVIKKRDSAASYLMLKDIFPQNAVDLGIMKKWGVLYRFFRWKEKQLYRVSDYIGCMSPANVKYLLEHNLEIDPEKVEIAPNSVELTNSVYDRPTTNRILLEKYNLPVNKPIFIYGGNIGKPQGIPFLIACLDANSQREDCHFLIVGDGFEYPRLESWYKEKQPKNVTVMRSLPKEDYDKLVQACHIGLICLDHRFTIPNFPSRLLSYLEYKMPVVIATDSNSDMGPIAQENGFGYWCQSDDVGAFTLCINKMLLSDTNLMGEKGYRFLCENYLIENTYSAIMRHFK